MKKILFYTLLISIFLSCKNQTQGVTEQENQHTVGKANDTSTKKTLSPHTFAMNMIGDAHIHIDYFSPSMRGRIIFGGLLPFDEVWQSGAHKATWFETNKDLLIDNKVLKAENMGYLQFHLRRNGRLFLTPIGINTGKTITTQKRMYFDLK